jgi:hypothetical protein
MPANRFSRREAVMPELTHAAKRDEPLRTDDEIAELVTQFEECRWPYARWTHRAHLAVAVWYLLHFPLDEATRRVRRNIPRYNATSGGPPDGYHETITVFLMRRLHQLMANHVGARSAAEWVEVVFPKCGKACLQEYYTPELLRSAQARAEWVEPDRKPLE